MGSQKSVLQGQYDKLFIGGHWVEPSSSESAFVISPSTEEPVARVAHGAHDDIDNAVHAARLAFDAGPWPNLPIEDRITLLRKISAQLQEREDEIAHVVTTEMGCPITLSTKMQSVGPRLLLDSFLDLASTYPWSDVRRSPTGNALVTREPAGVVGAIVPWNAPLLISMIKFAPALLAGCTMILKPAPETPLSAYLLADIVESVGLPDGVFNVVTAGREVSEYLVRHGGVDKISFTGSTSAGRRIAALCGEDLRRVTLELGGKSAAVLLEDADLDVAIPAIRALSLRNSGQVCSNKTRIVVSQSLRDELHDRLRDMIGSMPVGDPFNPVTEIGPLVSSAQRQRVEGYIEDAKSSGESLLVGGGRPEGLDHGWYVEPTIFIDVDPSTRIAQEEVFGPVLTVHTFESEAEAIQIANNSQYGLNGSVFSADPDHALEVARRIRTGTVELNGSPVGFGAPIGGFKNSGIGREAGPEGFDSYVELKSFGLPSALVDKLA